jgi:HPt (histidine-containing phosphotransfer) domain-containing protein
MRELQPDSILDHDRLAAITCGSEMLAKELVRSLVEEARVLAVELRRVASAPDATRAGDLAHALKGIAGNVGAPRLQRAAEAVEERHRSGGVPTLRSVDRVDEEVRALAELG